MKHTKLYIILIILLLSESFNVMYAQSSIQKKNPVANWYIGINGGVNIFFGDVKYNSFLPSTKMQELQPNTGIVFGRKFSTTLQLSSEINFNSLRGTKADITDSIGFKFQGLSFALKGHINPFALISKRESKFAFFLESGAGIMAWRSLLTDLHTNDTLNNLGWSNPNKEFGFYIPVGIKLEYKITPNLSTYFSNNYNFVFSDLLDGKLIGGYDKFSSSRLGINYLFGNQKEAPKLLPYNLFTIEYDSVTAQSNKNKTVADKEIVEKTNDNPFYLNLDVPETAPHTSFEINLTIVKIGIPAKGFFRIQVPSGFIPQSAPNRELSFVKLDYSYEYNFIFPLNQDSFFIPIQIKLSEIEKGNYPILIEGEIMNQKNQVFPIKFAKYIQIVSEDEWYKGLTPKEKEKYNSTKIEKKKDKIELAKNENSIIKKEEAEIQHIGTQKIVTQEKETISSAVYRIQIMASTTPHPNINSFIKKHNIQEELFVVEADGWYRYNIYLTYDRKEANELCKLVQVENNIPHAFPVYYENGVRKLNTSSANTKKETNTTSLISKQTIQKSANPQPIKIEQKQSENADKNKLLYRIEVAMAFDRPIPIYLLQNKIGQETIREFKQNNSFYYTIGEFEDLTVAKAFLEYTKTQFDMENAKIGQYQNDKRLKGVL